MALVSDIMLDGLTKTMEKLCTLVSELMLWITSLLFLGGWGVGGVGTGGQLCWGSGYWEEMRKKEKKSFLLLAIMLAFWALLKQTTTTNE